jgi:hypothetical protein
MLAAEPAKPSVSIIVRLASGPARSVSGARTTAGSSSEVFHMTFTPCGAFSAVLASAGSLPCATAIAA